MKDMLHGDAQKLQKKKKLSETRVLPETAMAADPMPSGIPPQGSVVVTISRQFGSGGSDIAHMVAQEAGLNYVDQKIITEVARRLNVDMEYATRQDEQTTGLSSNILEALRSSNPFNVHYMYPASKAQSQSQELAYFHLTQRVILELATQGNAIIVGRGSQFLLHNNPRTLHIHIFAPLEYRIDYVMRQYQLNRLAAREMIEQRDDEQASYLRRYYGVDGRRSNFYHLLINTGLFSFESATNFICQALPVVKAME
ncbi:cytidylate kinase-like family protein [Dictyobacter kobayashii]|uniref:Cytidylate kinase n=1 Tax=Dictyobacter kobayashii TaxID=2014872 RepID=A0A402AL23_9CHLR|nr:cytidylate kinase-like family protein [Dictyobacter kobayashii]GCE19908.1 hypothetical protein KDK_37080 [Dictyobacter kobayashii]